MSFAEEGLYGKACKVLCSKGIAPNNIETFTILANKHPVKNSPNIPRISESDSVKLLGNFDVKDCIRSFPTGTACGPSGLRIEHLLNACEAPLSVNIIGTIKKFLNVLLSRKAPVEAAPYFAGASLTALIKSDVGSQLDIRPIAVGEVLRRLAGKCICKQLVEKAHGILTPHQFGVACPGGVEQVIHHMRATVEESWPLESDFVILKVDMSNAFNTVSRQAVLDECASHIPEILPWVSWCYGSHPFLWHPLGRFESATGVQQGDPIGPFLFSLALNRLILSLQDVPGLSQNIWYLDDGLLCGTRSAIAESLRLIKMAQSWSGLQLNMAKCELFSKSDLSDFPTEMRKSNLPNFEVLGAPIGDDAFCESYIKRKRSAVEALLRGISNLCDPQVSVALLRTCGGFCKLSHLARCCPPQQVQQSLAHFDRAVMHCLGIQQQLN